MQNVHARCTLSSCSKFFPFIDRNVPTQLCECLTWSAPLYRSLLVSFSTDVPHTSNAPGFLQNSFIQNSSSTLKMKLRWGICTAGLISNDFVLALSLLPPEHHAVVAVAARSKERAEVFAKEHKIPVAYGGYESLAKDENIDIVYVGSWIHAHLPLCKLFLSHGKHVLCEKPLALNMREAQEIIDLAKERNLFLMEGWWNRFFPANVKLRELLDAGHIGEIKSVTGSFGIAKFSDERIANKEYGGGALLDIGVYLVQMTLMIFGQPPAAWSTRGYLAETGVDETTVTTLLFPNKAVASLTCSVALNLANEFEIRGTKGCIKIPPFIWCPLKLDVTTSVQKSENPLDLESTNEVLEFPIEKNCEGFVYPNSAGLQYEAEAVRQCIAKGLEECPTVTHKESLLVARILTDARHDVGYLLDADTKKSSSTPMPCQ